MPKYVDADVMKAAFLYGGKDVCDDTDEFDTKWGASQERIEEIVDSAPAADVEPVVHGHWYFRGGRPCCSVCNTKALWEDKGGTGGFSHEFVGAKSKRCPECGARMDAEPPKEEENAK